MKNYLFCLILFLPYALSAQNKGPVYVLDGVVLTISSQDLNQIIIPENIQKIDVLKGEAALQAYGNDLGKNGMVLITSKKPTQDNIPQAMRLVYGDGKPLLLIQGQVKPYQDLENLDSDKIASMEVIKNDLSYVKKYGIQAVNGVIKLEMKQ